MTVYKCDRCGKEINVNDFFVVKIYPCDKPSQKQRIDLCEWCYRCLMDWVNGEEQITR